MIVEGTWHTSSKTAQGLTFHDVTPSKEEVTVKPITEQSDWESRKLWGAVAKGIREGDFDTASKEKSRIENEQRQRRKDEAAAGTTWELKHFKPIASDPVCTSYLSFLSGSSFAHEDLFSDEKLGKLFKANPPTEDAYVFLDNAPA